MAICVFWYLLHSWYLEPGCLISRKRYLFPKVLITNCFFYLLFKFFLCGKNYILVIIKKYRKPFGTFVPESQNVKLHSSFLGSEFTLYYSFKTICFSLYVIIWNQTLLLCKKTMFLFHLMPIPSKMEEELHFCCTWSNRFAVSLYLWSNHYIFGSLLSLLICYHCFPPIVKHWPLQYPIIRFFKFIKWFFLIKSS